MLVTRNLSNYLDLVRLQTLRVKFLPPLYLPSIIPNCAHIYNLTPTNKYSFINKTSFGNRSGELYKNKATLNIDILGSILMGISKKQFPCLKDYEILLKRWPEIFEESEAREFAMRLYLLVTLEINLKFKTILCSIYIHKYSMHFLFNTPPIE